MLTDTRLPARHSALAGVALFLFLALTALAAATPAHASSSASCAKQVIADWFDNTRIDKIYPLHCYREAIKILPVDVRDYSSAREDILRALQYAQQGKPDPGDSGSGNGTGNGTGSGNGTDSGGNTGDGTGTSSVDTSGPSAVPIPLIVLAAIAGLLLVLGAAGYVTRRAAARNGGDDEPPA